MDARSDSFLSSPEWLAARDAALQRDANRCTVARLLGGACSGTLHVHHVVPRSRRPDLALDPDNLGTACASHHPTWESVARALRLLRIEDLPPCRHFHPYREGHLQCERQRRREMLDRRVGKLARA